MHIFRLLVSVSVLLGVVTAYGGEPVRSATAPVLPDFAAQFPVMENDQPNVNTSAIRSSEEYSEAPLLGVKKVVKKITWSGFTDDPEGDAVCRVGVRVKKRFMKKIPEDTTIKFKLKAKSGEASVPLAFGLFLGSGNQPNCDIYFDRPSKIKFLLTQLVNKRGAVRGGLRIDLHRHPNSDVRCVESGFARGFVNVVLEADSESLKEKYLEVFKIVSGCFGS